jgi:hypothetical protein
MIDDEKGYKKVMDEKYKNVPNVFLAEPVKILLRSSNNESIIT